MRTKERILLEALRLFSKKGYDAVSVEQIADAVGIKAPSLYKHYKSKQDILDRIIHNSYEVLIDGKISMRERHGLRSREGLI